MNYNSGTNLYSHIKTGGFSTSENHRWSVSCNAVDFDYLTVNDTIEIHNYREKKEHSYRRQNCTFMAQSDL